MQSKEEEGSKEEDDELIFHTDFIYRDSKMEHMMHKLSMTYKLTCHITGGHHGSQEIDVLHNYSTHENVCVITLSLLSLWLH